MALTPASQGPLQVTGTPQDGPLVRFSLVIPTYNESQNVASLIRKMSKILDDVLPDQYELIIVDDNSPDRTWAIAEQQMLQWPNLRVIRRDEERGLASAVIRGWQAARGEWLGVMDGDLQHPPAALPKLLDALPQGPDLVIGSRNVEGGGVSQWSMARRLLSRFGQLVSLVLLPGAVSRVSDPMSGFFIVRRGAVAGHVLSPSGYKILIEVLGRCDVERVTEVGYVFQERKHGGSKMGWKQGLEFCRHLLALRFSPRPKGKSHVTTRTMLRFFQFCLVGLSGVVVDMFFLFLLSDPSTLAWGLTRSKAIAAEIAILNNFAWNDLWTFQDLRRKQPGWRAWLWRLGKFNLICLSGLFLNVVLLNVLFNLFDINRYLANFIAILTVAVWNFWISLSLGWRMTQPEQHVPEPR